tara:strand:- start:89518 stop:90720 length:1203 start_codon:yes stop_codon:yes gene_type:complete
MNEWPVRQLGELCVFENGDRGKNYPGRKAFVAKGIPFINAGHISDGIIDMSEMNFIPREKFDLLGNGKIRKGDVLFCLRGSLGKFGIVTAAIEGAIASSLVILRPKENLDKYFLGLYLLSPLCQVMIDTYKNGAAQPNLSARNLKNFKIPLPPLPEQKRIVAILDEAFAAIDKAIANAEKNLANARELFESHLQALFAQHSDGWVEKTLGEIGKISMCKRILKKQTAASGDIPFYKIGTFGKVANAFISNEIYQEFREKYSFPRKGDILISASGTIGRRVIYDGEPAYFQDSNIVWIDNDESLVLNEYLYQFYGICDWNPSKGATISRLYNDDLKAIRISFPNTERQKDLVNEMLELGRQTQGMQTLYRKKLTELDELRKSLLHQAFNGQLTKSDGEVAV